MPPPDEFDWIQLKSGEWLKGRFKGMQERELEFDSEELDNQTFDWKDTRLSLDYIGNVSSIEGVESANDHRVNSEFDLWLSRRLCLALPFAEYYTDPYQNLAHEVTAGVGVGYDLVARPKMEWTLTTGPAYQMAWFESAQPGEPTEKGTAAFVFMSRFDRDVTRSIELILEYRGQYTSREVGETTHHSVSTLSLDLTKRLDLDVSFVWDRIANPKVGSDGAPPKQTTSGWWLAWIWISEDPWLPTTYR